MKNVFLILMVLTLSACGLKGERGKTGLKGDTGAPGADGGSCSVEQLLNGAVITCSNGTTALISNGINGLDGQDGADGQDGEDGADGQNAPPTAYTVTELINPCGDGPGHDEVLLRLANGQIIAHYAGGGNLQFLAVLSPGSYVTTDSPACAFTLHANGTVTW